MNKSSDQFGSVQTLDELADQFVQRIRNGEHPSIKEYKEAFPQFSADIDDLFPTLAELEKYDPLAVSNQKPDATRFQAPSQLGDYLIQREIGRGGMGVVYEAQHRTMRRRVALKVLPSSFGKPEYKKRFMREARAAGQLHHTNIVPVFEVGECDGVSFYAMQYIEGQNLDVVIDELKKFEQSGQATGGVAFADATTENSTNEQAFLGRKRAQTLPLNSSVNQRTPTGLENTQTDDNDGVSNQQQSAQSKFSLNGSGTSEWSQVGESGDNYFRRVARVGVQIADALQYAHNHGVLHRDIKPSNLILDTDGIVWITDFGLAKDDSDNLTHTGDIVGTLRYMAPERFKGDADVASEVYSLGLTLYELCTLRHAFDQSDRAQLMQQVTSHNPVSPRRIRPEIPRDLETVIVKAIAREPSRRYSSARQMSADLQRFIADRPVLARRVSIFEKVYRWGRRNPTRAALVSCLALICLMITAGSMYLADLNNKHATELGIENIRVLKEKYKTEEEKAKAEEALKKAETARVASQAHLYYAHLGNAEATTSSGKQGQNFNSIDSVRMAAKIVSELPLSPDKIEKRHVALRSAAIAAMGHWDVETVQQWKPEQDNWTASAAVDFANNRVAQADADGNIAIRKFGSDKIEFQLPSVGEQAWIPLFSPNGRFFLARYHHPVTMKNPVVILWDVDAKRQLLQLDLTNFDVSHCFSADSTMFATCRKGKTIEIYATETGVLKYSFQTEHVPNRILFADNDRQLIVTQNEGERIDFWKLNQTPEVVKTISIESDVTAMDWNDRLQQLAVGMDHEIVIWPPDDLESEPFRLAGHESRVVQLKLHPSGKAVMSSAWDGTTRLFDLVTHEEVVRMEGRGLLFGGFDESGSQIGYYRGLNEIGVWQLPNDRPVKWLISSSQQGGSGETRFIPGHSELLAHSSDDGVEIWNHVKQRLISRVSCGNARHLQFSDDGAYLFTGGPAGVQKWNFHITKTHGPGEYSFTTSEPETIWEGNVKYFDLIEQKHLLAVRVKSNYAKVIDLDTGDAIDVGPHIKMSQARLTPDGRQLITSTFQGDGIRIWDTATGDFIRDIVPGISKSGIAINERDNRIAINTGERRTELSIDDWSTLMDRKRVEPDGWAGAVAYSPDGNVLAVTYSRYLAQLADTKTGNTIALLEGPERFRVGDLDWSDDGKYLSVANNEQIQVWDVEQVRTKLRELGIDWSSR